MGICVEDDSMVDEGLVSFIPKYKTSFCNEITLNIIKSVLILHQRPPWMKDQSSLHSTGWTQKWIWERFNKLQSICHNGSKINLHRPNILGVANKLEIKQICYIKILVLNFRCLVHVSVKQDLLDRTVISVLQVTIVTRIVNHARVV